MYKLNLLFLSLSLVAATFFVSCKSSKSVPATPVAKVGEETEVIVPCDDQASDKNFFRGWGIGQSKDLNTAREKAQMNANQALATSISVVTKRVSERYVNDSGQSPADYAEIFETLSREVVQQGLNNVQVSCNKTMKTADGMYKVYMAVETGKDDVFAAISRKAEANQKIKTIYQRETFRKMFDSELENLPK